MTLAELWFLLIAVLWIGYFFLEGFDFGVGISLPFLAKDDTDKRLLFNSVGPVWDGNEVWLLVAGGATFAAFPEWYATLFSGFYLPLFLILVALIVRGLAFEYRSKRESATWRKCWDWALFGGSLVPALLWGVAFANIVNGVKIGANKEYVGGFFDLLNPYGLFGGVMTLLLFTLHGAIFLALKNEGELKRRAVSFAKKLSMPTAVVVILFLVWTYFNAKSNDHNGLVPGFIPVAAMGLVAAVSWLLHEKKFGWSFVATGLTIALIVVTLFLNLYPNVMPSSINDAFSLTIKNASSTSYTLKVMTVVAAIMVPIVLVYQGWTYWVFRQRLIRPVGSTSAK